MSQSGKVLRLYVEVRSAPDQNVGQEEGIPRGHLVQDSPVELLSQLASQTACQTPAKVSASHHLLQSPPKKAVDFCLQQAGTSPSVIKRCSAPCDEVCPVHSLPKSSSGKGTFLHTPPKFRRFSKEEVSDSMRSVVTFSYIEKSNVKTMDSPHNFSCKRGTREERSTPSCFCKRLSDPVWFKSPGSSCSSSPKLTFQAPGSHQQTFSPGLPQKRLDPIGMAATQRAVEEFGSPLLRIKLAQALAHTSSSHCNTQPRCQSWAGSPVQHRSNSVNLKDHITNRIQAVCGLPQSQAANWLSSQCRQHPQSTSCVESKSLLQSSVEDRSLADSPASKRHVFRSSSPRGAILEFGNNISNLNQLSNNKSSSPAHSPEVALKLAEEATKVSTIFFEARRSSLRNSVGEAASGLNSEEAQHFKQTLKMNIPLHEQHPPASENTNNHQPEKSFLKSLQTNQDECNQKPQYSVLSMSQTSPAIPSHIFRPSHPPTELSSPMRDPRQFQAELRTPYTPTLHRHQLLQYTRDSWSLDKKGDTSCFERGYCTELARRLYINHSVDEAPVSWTSRQQWWNHMEDSPEPSLESGFGSVNDQTPQQHSSCCRTPLSPVAQLKRAEQRRREILLLGPVVLDSPEEDEVWGDAEQGLQRADKPPEVEQNRTMGGGSSSRSSSGVTGSLGDRDCVSPESSQSSHQSNETGAATSGIQVGFY